MNNRRLATAAVALSSALALTACGSSSPSAGPVAPATSPAVSSVAYTPLTKANFGTTVGSKVSSVKTLHMTMASSAMKVSADMNYGPPLAMQMTMTATASGKSMNVVAKLIGTTMYLQIPQLTPAGKFMALDLSKVPQTSPYVKLLDQYRKLGPASMTSMFKSDVTALTYVGTAQIDGQTARHYTTTVNTAGVLKALGSLSSSSALASQMKTVTEQVYLTDNQLPLRVTMSLPAPVGAMQVDFSKWGQPVTITAPPAADVMSIPASALG